MATFDPSDLVQGLKYPNQTWGRPGSRINPRTVPPSAERDEQTDSSVPHDDGLYHLCLIESGKPHKPSAWAAPGALIFELLVLAALILIPLYHIDPLPKRELLTMLYLAPPPAAAPITPTKFRVPTRTYTPSTSALTAPKATEELPPPPAASAGGVIGGVPGGVANGILGGVMTQALASSHAAPIPAQAPAPAPPKRVRLAARVAEANLIYNVPPKYPPEAGQAHIEGSVVLMAVIGKDGTVQDVEVVSGVPVLAQAAIDAVRQWRYKPYLVDGEPVEIDSRITINFTLSRG